MMTTTTERAALGAALGLLTLYGVPVTIARAAEHGDEKAAEHWKQLQAARTVNERPPEPAAPSLAAVLQEAMGAWAEQFDGNPETDISVNGGDLVDWFSQWRLKARAALRAAGVDAGQSFEEREAARTFAHIPERCPSKHWNDGTDRCADCGEYLG